MRAFILVAVAGLAVSGCADKSASESDSNASANLASEAIFSNDTTAIDAATGDSANMAADVLVTGTNADSDSDVSSSGEIDRRSATRRSTQTEPAANSADDASQMETATETNDF